MADNVIKIDLFHDEKFAKWNNFVTKAFNSCINRNADLKDHVYTFNYEPDEIEITYNKIFNDMPLALKSVSLDRNSYEAGNLDDKDILENLFNTIQSES